MGLALIVDDGDPTLAYSGFRLYREADRYLIRVWHQLVFRDLIRAYSATLVGEPRNLMWSAFDLTRWEDLPADGSGFWGPGELTVYQASVDPLVATGRLLPY